MVNEKRKPYGYIYRATNKVNGKVYIGQTVTERWRADQVPIKERWEEDIKLAYSLKNRGLDLRYIEKAIIKYGSDNFELKEQDTAQNQKELTDKENNWMDEYDTLNPDKGYNLRKTGEGGRLTDQVKEKMSNTMLKKWREDLEYIDKQMKAKEKLSKDPKFIEKMIKINREKAQDPKFIEKITKINRETGQDPKFIEKMTKIMRERGQNPKFIEKMIKIMREVTQRTGYKENMSKILSAKWQDNEYVDKQMKSRQKFRKEINDKREFLQDIQRMQQKEIAQKYDMNRNSVTKRIQEMLGEHGVRNYTEAKVYLQDKDLNEVLKEINDRMNNQTSKFEGKTEITDKRVFLEDIQKKQKQEIDKKYGMDGRTINKRIEGMLGAHGVRNYTEAKAYLQDKDLNEVVKDIEEYSQKIIEKGENESRDKEEENKNDNIKEKTEDRSQKENKVEGSTEGNLPDGMNTDSDSKNIDNKTQNHQENPEINEETKNKTINETINNVEYKEPSPKAISNKDSSKFDDNFMEENSDTSGINNTSDKSKKDFECIRGPSEGKNIKKRDNKNIVILDVVPNQINNNQPNENKDFNGIKDIFTRGKGKGNDFDGINDISTDDKERDKDRDAINDIFTSGKGRGNDHNGINEISTRDKGKDHHGINKITIKNGNDDDDSINESSPIVKLNRVMDNYGINENLHESDKDYYGINEISHESGKDYDGINEISHESGKDYDNIDMGIDNTDKEQEVDWGGERGERGGRES